MVSVQERLNGGSFNTTHWTIVLACADETFFESASFASIASGGRQNLAPFQPEDLIMRIPRIVFVLLSTVVSPALFAAPFTVINFNDSGPGSLRQANLDANADATADMISFSIPGSGVHTITPASALPTITNPLTIDRSTQPGFAGTPLIEIAGGGAI